MKHQIPDHQEAERYLALLVKFFKKTITKTESMELDKLDENLLHELRFGCIQAAYRQASEPERLSAKIRASAANGYMD